MLSHFLHLLFPIQCAGCKKHKTALCDACLKKIPLAPPAEDRQYHSIYHYGNPLVYKAIWELKYHRHSELCLALTKAAAPHIKDIIADILQTTSKQEIVFVPIPQHQSRTHKRGFSPSALIATWLIKEIPEASVQQLLTKTIATTSQATLHSKQARLKNLIGSMIARPCNHTTLYVIIDDVTTTGATMVEAQRALKKAGAKKVIGCTLAHGYRNKYSQLV